MSHPNVALTFRLRMPIAEITVNSLGDPAREAARFRDQLDLVSVDGRRLFPDLDGVAAEMRRYYS